MKNGVTVATDDLGRETVMNGGYVSDGTKNVGLFYFLWMGEHGDSGILDITKILQAGGEAAKKAYACKRRFPLYRRDERLPVSQQRPRSDEDNA